jgi:hypothetical protein
MSPTLYNNITKFEWSVMDALNRRIESRGLNGRFLEVRADLMSKFRSLGDKKSCM